MNEFNYFRYWVDNELLNLRSRLMTAFNHNQVESVDLFTKVIQIFLLIMRLEWLDISHLLYATEISQMIIYSILVVSLFFKWALIRHFTNQVSISIRTCGDCIIFTTVFTSRSKWSSMCFECETYISTLQSFAFM